MEYDTNFVYLPMRKITCDCCNNPEVALNSSVKIDGKVHCENCVKSNFTEGENLEGRVTHTDLDPTICAYCQKDFDERELRKLSKYPICDPCHADLQKRILPVWVKAFFAGILILVLFSFFWNWRFYQGYRDLNTSTSLASVSHFEEASKTIHQASTEVPEVEDLKTLDNYYKGMDLFYKDKSKEAYKAFMLCKSKLPTDYNLDYLIYTTQGSACFDDKDYRGFLKASQQLNAIDSTHIGSILCLASSYSCIYATEGNETDKQKSLAYIKKAKAIDSTSTSAKVYYNMIDYRLTTHQVVDRTQFVKQFPKGWTKP